MKWVALNNSDHSEKALVRKRNFSFAKDMLLLQLSTFELEIAVNSTPVVFSDVDGTEKIFGLFGIERGENLFVDLDGNWLAAFVPACLQVFPFRIGKFQDEKHVLTILEDSDLIVPRENGDPLFNRDGRHSDVVRKVIEQLTKIEKSNQLIEIACGMMRDFDLLEDLKICIQKPDKKVVELLGVKKINLENFNKLEDRKLLELRKVMGLEIIFSHLFSMQNFAKLAKAISVRRSNQAGLRDLGGKIFLGEEADLNFNLLK